MLQSDKWLNKAKSQFHFMVFLCKIRLRTRGSGIRRIMVKDNIEAFQYINKTFYVPQLRMTMGYKRSLAIKAEGRLDHKPHYKSVSELCDAALFFKLVMFCYVLDYQLSTRNICVNSKGCTVSVRRFCLTVFFVLCGSLFETIATRYCIGSLLCFCEMGTYLYPHLCGTS